MGSVPDFSEDALDPEIQFRYGDLNVRYEPNLGYNVSRYVDDVIIEVQEGCNTYAGACCTQNRERSDEHDVQCQSVNYNSYPNQWNLGFTPIQSGPPGLVRIGEESEDESSDSSDSEIMFLSSQRQIVNVGTPDDQGPRRLIFSIGELEDNRLDSDGESLELSEAEEDSNYYIPMCFPTHPPLPRSE